MQQGLYTLFFFVAPGVVKPSMLVQVCLAVSRGGEETGNLHGNTCFYVADTIMLWGGK